MFGTMAALWLLASLSAPAFWPWSSSRTDDLKSGIQALEDGLPAYAERRLSSALNRASTPEEKAEVGYYLARSLWLQERNREAAALLAEVVAPAVPPAARSRSRLLQARVALALDAADEVAGFLEDLDPLEGEEAAQRHRLLGRARLRQGRIPAALEQFEAFARNFPDHPEAEANQLDRAVVRIRLDEGAVARPLLEPLAEPGRPGLEAAQARIWLARLDLAAGEPGRATKWIEALGTLADLPPDLSVQAWAVTGTWQEARGLTEAALASLGRAYDLASDPEMRLDLAERRARLLFAAGQVPEGLALVRQTVTAHADHPLAGRMQLAVAQTLFDRGEAEASAREFQAYMEAFQDPQGLAVARLGRAWSLWKLGHPVEAAPLFLRAWETLPEGAARKEALRKAAEAWYAANRFEDCLDAVQRFVNAYPEDPAVPDLGYLEAESLARLDRPDAAVEAYRRLAEAHPESAAAERVGLALGRLHERTGQTAQAERVYQEWLSKYPGGPQAAAVRLRRGLLGYRGGRFEDALSEFDRILESEAPDAIREQAYFMRSWCYYMLGDVSRSLAVRQSFLERFPKSEFLGDVLFSVGEHHFNQQEFAEAERAFLLISERQPDSALAVTGLYWAGRSAAARREFQRALQHYRNLAESAPSHSLVPETRFAQGDALTELNDFPGAILAFEQVARDYPDSYLAPRAWGRKADCHFTLGTQNPEEYEKAIAAYRLLLERAQASPDLKIQTEYKIARCYEKLGRLPEAIENYLHAVYRFDALPSPLRGDGDVWFTRSAFRAAEHLEALGRAPEALAVFRKVAGAGVAAAPDAQRAIRRLQRVDWNPFRPPGPPGSP